MKYHILKISLILIVLISVFPQAGSAVEMSAGIYTWYAWWDYFKPDNKSISEDEVDPTLLYGPALSVNFDQDYSLTCVFLYGKYDVATTYHEYDGNPADELTCEFTRIDTDSALNYRLNSYFKIYLGIKYSSYSYQNEWSENNNYYSGEYYHKTFGPAGGVSFILPIVDQLYFISNLGVFHLWSKEKSNDPYDDTSDTNDDCRDYGFNASISLAYYIEPASTTINLGGRYQFFKTWSEADDEDYENDKDDTTSFYGITLSATYSFSI